MKQTLTALFFCLGSLQAFSQKVKEIPPSNLTPGQTVNLNIRPWHSPTVPAIDNPFGVSAINFQPLAVSPGVKITMGDEGLPIFFEGTPFSAALPVDESTAAAGAIAYLVSLQPAGSQDPSAEFVVKGSN
ncbi:MAG: hypothetical protein IPH31_09665 [Lewinellaceae bacterium]|nr:hypothetical protein [Lewinellaceae bacterium]